MALLAGPSADEDLPVVDLPTEVRSFLVASVHDVTPGRLASFDRAAYLACLAGRPPPIDPRWLDVYTSPVLAAAFDWVGLDGVLGRGSPDPGDTKWSASGIPLAELFANAEKRFDALLRKDLARFWDELPGLGGPEPDAVSHPHNFPRLFSPKNLALAWSLFLAACFADLAMSRLELSRTFVKHITAIYRAAGYCDPEHATDLDIWQLGDCWNSVWWFSNTYENWTALHTGQKPAYDPARDFPDAIRNAPPEWIAVYVPKLASRPLRAPIPAQLLKAPKVFAKEYYGWLNPSIGATNEGMKARKKVLAACISDMKNVGPLAMGSMIPYLAVQVLQFNTWLKEEAGLSMLEVIIAAGFPAEARPSPVALDRKPLPADLDPELQLYWRRISSNVNITEALRQHQFLRGCIEAIMQALPEDIAKAASRGDVDKLSEALPGIAQINIGLLICYICHLRELDIELCSPELFTEFGDLDYGDDSDLVEENRPASSLLSADEDLAIERDLLMEQWYSSVAFQRASSNAMVISKLLRSMLDSGRLDVKSDLFNTILCYSASHAAWLHLLILKRYRKLVATAMSASMMSQAAQVYEDIRADIKACLDCLKASGKENQQSARVLLEEIFEGRSTTLSPSDLEMLRLARKLSVRCPHGENNTGGTCWLCASSKNNSRNSLDRGVPNDYLAAQPFPSSSSLGALEAMQSLDINSANGSGTILSGGTGGLRKVRFHPQVSFHETYSKAEYPARSMMAPFDPELESGERKDTSEALKLLEVLRQRAANELPKLAEYWQTAIEVPV